MLPVATYMRLLTPTSVARNGLFLVYLIRNELTSMDADPLPYPTESCFRPQTSYYANPCDFIAPLQEIEYPTIIRIATILFLYSVPVEQCSTTPRPPQTIKPKFRRAPLKGNTIISSLLYRQAYPAFRHRSFEKRHRPWIRIAKG